MKFDVYIIAFALVASIEATPKAVFPENPLHGGTLEKVQGASSDIVEAENDLEPVETKLQNDTNTSSYPYKSTESIFTDISNPQNRSSSNGKLRLKNS